MNEYNKQVLWLAYWTIGTIFSALPPMHELAHALTAILLNFKVYSVSFWSTSISGSHWLVGLSGGLANAVCLIAVLMVTQKHVMKFQNIIVFASICFFIVYAFIEGFAL